MTQQLYIKTDGPIPEDCDYITAGKVYEATPSDGPHYYGITDDNGAARDVSLLMRCVCTVCRPGWYFCDELGNPVPAPWEDETAEEIYPVNWQAHAEALAEALEMMVEMIEFGGFGKAAAMDTARAALAAFDQDRRK